MRIGRSTITARCAGPAPSPRSWGEGWGEGSSRRPPALAVAILALSTTLALSGTARADTFALLAPSGPADLPAAIRTSAIDTLVVALRANSHRSTVPVDVARQLAAARAPECVALDCARSIIAALHVDGVIETVLWSDGAGGIREVVVSIARASGAETSGTSGIGPGGLATAVRTALTQALSATGGAPAPVRLVVRVSPRGAALTLDGRPLGEAPWEGLLPPGHHVLVAGHVGFLIERREVELRTEPVELAIELARDPEADIAPEGDTGDGAAASDGTARAGGARGGRRSSGRAVFGPIVLGAVGVALLTVDGFALASIGETRVRRDSLDVPIFVTYALAGVGALTTGLLWFLLSGGDNPPPARVTVDIQPSAVVGAIDLRF